MRRKMRKTIKAMAAVIAAMFVGLLCKGRTDLTPSGVILGLLLMQITAQAACEYYFIKLEQSASIQMMTGRRAKRHQKWNWDLKDTGYVFWNI